MQSSPCCALYRVGADIAQFGVHGMILVTGGAGFIGSNFVLNWLSESSEPIVNIDKLTYAGNLNNLSTLDNDSRHIFVRGTITDERLLDKLFEKYQPRAVINFAAESHVDRSISGPEEFIQTNVIGTFRLLESARKFWQNMDCDDRSLFRFVQVSTDEVFGSLEDGDLPFTEQHRYQPNSPYSASKAASDHLVRAWFHTFGLPVVITNCSNNYGPLHYPEKLIPLCIVNALEGKNLPIYGDGKQVRDWLYVEDHCSAIRAVLKKGKVGETYNIGGWNEMTNISLIDHICTLLDELQPREDGLSYKTQITFVDDRPGHDRRYAINAHKIALELGWKPIQSIETGLRKTVNWYLENRSWVRDVQEQSVLKNGTK